MSLNISNIVISMYDVIEPCSDSGAYVTEPTDDVRLDMDRCEKLLEDEGYDINFSAEVILLVKDKKTDIEIGVYPSGKLLFKTTDEEKIQDSFERIKSLVKKVVG